MQRRVNVLLRCLLKLLVDVSSDSELSLSVRQKLMEEAVLSIKLLDAAAQGQIQVCRSLMISNRDALMLRMSTKMCVMQSTDNTSTTIKVVTV